MLPVVRSFVQRSQYVNDPRALFWDQPQRVELVKRFLMPRIDAHDLFELLYGALVVAELVLAQLGQRNTKGDSLLVFQRTVCALENQGVQVFIALRVVVETTQVIERERVFLVELQRLSVYLNRLLFLTELLVVEFPQCMQEQHAVVRVEPVLERLVVQSHAFADLSGVRQQRVYGAKQLRTVRFKGKGAPEEAQSYVGLSEFSIQLTRTQAQRCRRRVLLVRALQLRSIYLRQTIFGVPHFRQSLEL